MLESDATLPCVARIVAGGAIRGSWWGHPRGQEIFRVSGRMASNRNVLVSKLVSKKVTYVHRRLWPLVIAVGSARQVWQMSGLSRTAKLLLASVDRAGRIRTDNARIKRRLKGKSVGDAARELEIRLLIHSEEVHTEAGAHARNMETWKSWSNRVSFHGKEMRPEDAKMQLDALLAQLNRKFGATASLPWNWPFC